MAQQHARLHELYERWINNSATESEKAEFFSLMQAVNDPEALDAAMREIWLQQLDDQYYTPDKRLQLAHTILQTYRPQLEEEVMQQPVHRVHFLRTAWFRYAAAIILLAGAGVMGWYLLHTPKQEVATITPATPKDIAPGGNKAILTLADGSVIDLDKTGNGTIAKEGKTIVNKKEDGQIEYQGAHSPLAIDHSLAFNTLKTPKGGQYQITLPDGTKVWLNAASSITYPTAFTGNERRITMTGEIYLEVSKDKTKPFHVQFTHGGGRQYDVEVLGTHFNVNAYNDEPVAATTLLEGKVRQRAEGKGQRAENINVEVILKPGEQAIVKASPLTIAHSPLTINHSPDIDQIMAWKNGAFNFNDKKLVEVMRQLSRWYDVDVIYENNNIPDKTFYGEMGRNLNLSQCLTILEKMQVHFRIEAGRKLVVMP